MNGMIELVRIRPTRGPWGDQVERLASLESGPSAKDLLKMGKLLFPSVPRHELALVGFPEMPEWEVES